MDEKFGKEYKLCSRKTIDALFKEKKSVRSYPLVVYYSTEMSVDKAPFQIVFSAPKRSFKRAHDRNYVKRLMKETLRKNKMILENYLLENEKQLVLFMIYNQRELPTFEIMEKGMVKIMNKLIDELATCN